MVLFSRDIIEIEKNLKEEAEAINHRNRIIKEKEEKRIVQKKRLIENIE